MKKKLLAGILAAAMLMGLASATFASNNTTDTSYVELTATPTTITVKVGETQKITATAKGHEVQDSTKTLPTTVTYVSADPAKVEVANDGTVKGLAVCEDVSVTVSATAGNATTTEIVKVTVTAASVTPPEEQTVTSVKIAAPASTTPAPGTDFTLTATIVTSDGEPYTGSDKGWGVTPLNAGVTVDENGKVVIASTVATGTVFTIKYTAGGQEDSVQITVTAASSGDNNNTNNGGSTSTGGGSSSGSTTTTTTPAEETVSTTEAVAKTEQAIEAAVKADPDVVVVVVKVKNAKSITAAALKAVAKAAEKAEKTPVIHADVVKDGKVESRLYIDPSLVKGNGEIKLGVTLGDEKVSTKFDKYFKNDIAVVKFDQAGSFGMNIKAAVKLDLSKLDTKNLVFYSYDPKTNRYTKMSVSDYRIDANGYLHFTTSVGNCVLVTDEPLARK